LARYIQARGERGSQKWLQVAIENNALSLNDPIAARLDIAPATIDWLSPLSDDDYAEYRDQAFLDRLDVVLANRPLNEFWPRRGPQWDGLGRSEVGDLLLVEAKAHIGEMASPPSRASDRSLAIIGTSLAETQRYLNVPVGTNWTNTFYQYTNRLAHLYLLRVLNELPAWLVFVYFVGDADMNGPSAAAEWQAAIGGMYATLQLDHHHALSKFMIDVFVDVDGLDGGR